MRKLFLVQAKQAFIQSHRMEKGNSGSKDNFSLKGEKGGGGAGGSHGEGLLKGKRQVQNQKLGKKGGDFQE